MGFARLWWERADEVTTRWDLRWPNSEVRNMGYVWRDEGYVDAAQVYVGVYSGKGDEGFTRFGGEGVCHNAPRQVSFRIRRKKGLTARKKT